MSRPLMYVLLTPDEMGRADQMAMASGMTGAALMEAAGLAVAQAVTDRFDQRPVLVVCGPGNNGGDGFVAARALREQGWPVQVALLGETSGLKGDAAWHAARWAGDIVTLGGEGRAGSDPGADIGLLDGVGLVIDALIGAGLSRDFDGIGARLLQEASARGVPICAIDMPSGVDGATGAVRGHAVAATITVTFFRKKPGHLLFPGRGLCGALVLADIGIPQSVLSALAPKAFENTPPLWLACFPWPQDASHKYRRGHVLVYGGTHMTGAARLTALSAARIGAGLVTIAAAPEAWPIYAAAMTSVMVEAVPGGDLTPALADERRNAVAIGPGAGSGEQTRHNVLAAARSGRAMVLDADALTAFAEDPATLFAAIKSPCVLTPHEGEFVRLFDLDGDKLVRARAAASQSGAVVILKGADTVVADPDGRAVVNANGTPWLATGGTGDVLTGMVAGLLAQGMPAFEAACAAVWMHAAAGRLAGPGLISEDLPNQLPHVLRQLCEPVWGSAGARPAGRSMGQ